MPFPNEHTARQLSSGKKMQHLAVSTDLAAALVEYIVATPTGHLPFAAARNLITRLQNCNLVNLEKPPNAAEAAPPLTPQPAEGAEASTAKPE